MTRSNKDAGPKTFIIVLELIVKRLEGKKRGEVEVRLIIFGNRENEIFEKKNTQSFKVYLQLKIL